MKHLAFLSSIIFCLVVLFSCTTASVKYNTNIEYDIQEIVYPTSFFLNKKKIMHQDYALVFDKNIQESSLPEYNDGGFFSNTTGISYNFYKSDLLLARVDIYKMSKGFSLAKRSFSIKDSVSYIKTSNAFGMKYEYQLDEKSKTELLTNTTFNIIAEPIRESYQNKKTYTLWNNDFAGVRLIINDEEYAIVDFLSEPRILYNKNFSQTLEEPCMHQAILLMLSLFDYNRSIRNMQVNPTKDKK